VETLTPTGSGDGQPRHIKKDACFARCARKRERRNISFATATDIAIIPRQNAAANGVKNDRPQAGIQEWVPVFVFSGGQRESVNPMGADNFTNCHRCGSEDAIQLDEAIASIARFPQNNSQDSMKPRGFSVI
jgi:hypothetical protein